MSLTAAFRLQIAQKVLEGLLPFHQNLTIKEALLWGMLLRAIPITRTCRACSEPFTLKRPSDVTCPRCRRRRATLSFLEDPPSEETGLPQLVIGVQAGLILTRNSLVLLQEQAPVIVDLLEQDFAEDRFLTALTTAQATPSISDTIHTLCRVAQTWIGHADEDD
jgi:hypothetical protein